MNEENKQEKKQETEEQTPKKEGVERLKEIGLKEVSNKTFINLDNLTALVEKEFDKLNRTKALGFIQILEREFSVNLQELKNESLQFYNSHTKAKKRHQEAAVAEIAAEEKPKKILRYVLLALIAGVGAYYLLSNTPKSDRPEVMDLNVVKNDTVTNEAKENLLVLDAQDESELNESDEVDLNKVVEEMFKNSEDNESALENRESNNSEENSTILPATEENLSLENNDSVIENSTKMEVKATQIPKTVKEPVQKVVKKEIKKEVKNLHKEGLYITPIQKAWVGVIFLDSMKKKDFLIRNTLKLDASKDQIILVGHNKFKIYNKRLEQGFKSKKMVRFLYRDGELREISKREYRELRGGVKW